MRQDGNSWIEHDEDGNPYGRWTWSEEGMWVVEILPASSNRTFADHLTSPAGIIIMVGIVVVCGGLLTWWFVFFRKK